MPRAAKATTTKPSKATIKPKRSSSNDTEDANPTKATTPKASPRKAEPWTAEQDLLLFNELYQRKPNPDWVNVAKNVGRDKKACMNRYERHLKKNLEGAAVQKKGRTDVKGEDEGDVEPEY